MSTPNLSGVHDGDQLLSLCEIADLVGLRATATKELVRRAGFPPAVRLSQRVVRWWRSEVLVWLDSQRSTYRLAPLTGPSTAPCPSLRRGRARRHH